MDSHRYGSLNEDGHENLAVYCHDVVKRYSSTGPYVLNNAALKVPRNSIYALLGPSGCGKTTLLRCVTGRLHPHSGTIKVYGLSPKEHGQKQLGGMIGYMPQEFALHYQLTLSDTFFFFGRVFGMKRDEIRQRMLFLLDFLELPEPSRLVVDLSGGQQRRASLAVALLHNPPLLILDEPTVGVDPLLREKIWHYLREIVNSQHVTVIITTHYIEEARLASIVSLMRGGRILVEASPNWIMEQLGTATLEAAFVELCRRQGFEGETDALQSNANENVLSEVGVTFAPAAASSTKLKTAQSANSFENPAMQLSNGNLSASTLELTPSQTLPQSRKKCTLLGVNGMNIAAIFIRNATVMSRMIGFLLFQFFLPAIQITLFCWCVGPQPRNLPLAVVNLDIGMPRPNFTLSTNVSNYVDPVAIIQHRYGSYEEGVDSVRRGETFGLMLFKPNFTSATLSRAMDQTGVDNKTIDQGQVHLFLDFTNVQIALVFEQKIALAYQTAINTLLLQFGMNPSLAEPFIKMDTPIYGSLDSTNLDYMAPGIITSIPFFLAIGLTALSFVTEAKTGILDRCLVSGVNMVEIMLALGSVELIIMLVQITVTMVIALIGFGVTSQGSIALVVLIVVVAGLSAMGIGLIISACTSEEMSAIQLAMGIVYPNLMLCGLMWPIQAMPTWLQPFSQALPLTFASEAVRSVLGRGWGLEHSVVWLGMLVPIAWIVVTFSLAAFIMYLRKR